MRVIAGLVGGRRLASVPGVDVRPTSERVRQALFNRLQSRDLIAGAAVLDLFAGSGAMGIEALSRGARSATFVDQDRRSIAVVRDNLRSLGLAEHATVHQAEAISFLRMTDRTWDLALLDPPYDYDQWTALLDVLRAVVAVLETPAPPDPHPRWATLHHRRYGRAHITLLAPRGE